MNGLRLSILVSAALIGAPAMTTPPAAVAATFPKVFHTKVDQATKSLSDLYLYSPTAKTLMDDLVRSGVTVEVHGRLMPDPRAISKTVISDKSARVAVDFYKCMKNECEVALILAYELKQLSNAIAGSTPTLVQEIPDAYNLGTNPVPRSASAIKFHDAVRKELADAKRLAPKSRDMRLFFFN